MLDSLLNSSRLRFAKPGASRRDEGCIAAQVPRVLFPHGNVFSTIAYEDWWVIRISPGMMDDMMALRHWCTGVISGVAANVVLPKPDRRDRRILRKYTYLRYACLKGVD
jgi:hypothetical protein